MKALVSAATRHGATSEIAQPIADSLTAAGLEVDVLPPDEVSSLHGYDTALAGSAVYMGRWLDPARRLVERLGVELAARPVWFFSSGPVGDPPKPQEDPVDVAALMETTHARGHRLFAGQIDKARLGLGEKVIVKALKVTEGDYRPWDEIRAWAGEIAAALAAAPAS